MVKRCLNLTNSPLHTRELVFLVHFGGVILHIGGVTGDDFYHSLKIVCIAMEITHGLTVHKQKR